MADTRVFQGNLKALVSKESDSRVDQLGTKALVALEPPNVESTQLINKALVNKVGQVQAPVLMIKALIAEGVPPVAPSNRKLSILFQPW